MAMMRSPSADGGNQRKGSPTVDNDNLRKVSLPSKKTQNYCTQQLPSKSDLETSSVSGLIMAGPCQFTTEKLQRNGEDNVLNIGQQNLDDANHRQTNKQADVEIKTYGPLEVNDNVLSAHAVLYRVDKYLGKGGYGEVYQCYCEATKKMYALKRESVIRTKIPKEIEVLKSAEHNHCRQVCKYVDDGRQGDEIFVIMTLLGKDLSKLRRERKTRNFSLSTSVRVGLLTLSAIRELHQISVVSRDIKPSNFALGRNEHSRNIYIFDFGLSRFYRDKDGSILPAKQHPGFRGTTRYASLRAHQKLELGRRDDLESWIYVMVELSSGTLPWKTPRTMKEKKKQLKEQVYRAKLQIRSGNQRKHFFRNSLPILDYVFVMIDALAFEADPPYDQIQYMFEKLMLEADVKWDDAYDWEDITPQKHLTSADAVTSTSAAIVTFSQSRRCPLVPTLPTMTPTASTESSSLPHIQLD